MDVRVTRGNSARIAGDALVVIAPFQDDARRPPRSLDRGARELVGPLFRSGDFRGRMLETSLQHLGGRRPRRLLVVGAGASPIDPHRLRHAAGHAARVARELGLRRIAVTAPLADLAGEEPGRAVQALAEGLVLGAHRSGAYRTEPASEPLAAATIVLESGDVDRWRAEAARGSAWADAACLARDLAATPGQDLTPEGLGEAARRMARETGARAQVLEPAALGRLGMNAVLAVGRGSTNGPRFIVLEREADGSGDRRAARGRDGEPAAVVLVGKGVTFDTGGISLKPREGMARMKYDMSGAAAVIGVFAALPSLVLPFRVIGLIPSAENMPGSGALKPGDVIRTLDGATVEVTNTDAEGRLLLADALAYARRLAPVAVIDVATLTGAISIALGHLAAGLFTSSTELAAELLAAAEASGERLWRMPLWDDYAAELRSDTADLVNSGPREGGASIAAAFLARFARDLPWAHIDIASTAWAYAERGHEARGPNGFGVRLLLEWLAARARAAGAPVVEASPSRRSKPVAKRSAPPARRRRPR